MFVDLKPDILQALRTNTVLVNLLGKDDKGKVKVYPEVAPNTEGAYITFFELTNFNNRYGSNLALSSEIHYQVDVWSKGNTSAIAIAVNDVMNQLEFVRTSARDIYEKETKTFHKALRYKKIHFI